MTKSAENLVLTEAQAVELLALLVTSARTQLGEPAVYGPMRLLTAAERLGSFIEPNVSPSTRAFLREYVVEIGEAQGEMAHIDRYTDAVDGLCRGIAGHLVARSGMKDGAS